MKIFTAFLVSLLIAVVGNAQAAVGGWDQLQNPGQAIYEIEDANGTSLSINCVTDKLNRKFYGHMVWYYGEPVGATNAEDNAMSIVVDNKDYRIPTIDGSDKAEHDWTEFVNVLNNANNFDIKINGKKVASYSVTGDKLDKSFLEHCGKSRP